MSSWLWRLALNELKQLLAEAIEKSVIVGVLEVGIRPWQWLVGAIFVAQRDFFPDSVATVEAMGVILRGGKNNPAIVEEPRVNIHGPLDRPAAAFEHLLLHRNRSMLDASQAILRPTVLEHEKFPLQRFSHGTGVGARLGKWEEPAFALRVKWTEPKHDELSDDFEKRLKAREDPEKKVSGRSGPRHPQGELSPGTFLGAESTESS